MPWFELFGFFLVYLIQMLRRPSKQVSGSQDLDATSFSSYSLQGNGAAYVRCMIMKSQVVIYDRIVGVVCLEQVF